MFAKAFVFVCATFGLVAGSCFDLKPQQETSQILSFQATPSFITAPIQNGCSSGSSDIFSSGQVLSAPVCASGSSIPVVAESSVTPFSFPTASSGNSVAQIISGSSCGSEGLSFGVQATNGPETSPLTVLQAPTVTLPASESPCVTLSSPAISGPRVLSERCYCTKTVLRPQVYQRTVAVPKIQRYIKRTVTPVIENYSYKSTPVTQEASSLLFSGAGSSSSPLVLPSASTSSATPLLFSSGSSASSIPLSGSACATASPVVLAESSCPRFF